MEQIHWSKPNNRVPNGIQPLREVGYASGDPLIVWVDTLPGKVATVDEVREIMEFMRSLLLLDGFLIVQWGSENKMIELAIATREEMEILKEHPEALS